MHLMRDVLRSFLCLDHKFLVWNMVGRNLKLRYRRSALGYLWTLLVPLSTAFIYYVLFTIIFKIPTPNFAAYVTTSILVWSFFSSTLNEGMGSLLGNLPLLLQVNVPLNVFPITTAVSSLTTLVLALPVIFGVCIADGIQIGWSAIMLFPYLALLFIQAYCFGYMLSVAVVYVRDLKQAMGPFMQIWMYGTPILYQIDRIPERYSWVLYSNPVGKIFAGIHNSVLRANWPTYAEMGAPILWTVVIFTAAVVLHTKVSKKAVERI